MSRRVLALIMTFVMIFSLLPASAFAEEPAGEEVLLEEQTTAEEAPVTEEEPAEEPQPEEEPTPADTPEVQAVTVRFSCTPAAAEVTVFDAAGEAAAPEDDGSYLLLPGDYTYTASCEGYIAAENVSFTVADGSAETAIDVVLEAEAEPAAAVPQSVSGEFNGSPAALDDSGNLLVNEENFPDETFRSYISENFDPNGNGFLTAEAAAEVTTINCDGVIFDENGVITKTGTITSFKGVEYFANLYYLQCRGNQMTELDVSKNTLLQSLDCSWSTLASLTIGDNENLTYLQCGAANLTSLDVSGCPALQKLYCTLCGLTSLDVSKNTMLEVLATGDNPLTSLDVSKNTALKELYCYNNGLTSIDVSRNTLLEQFNCGGNALTSLDVSKNTALTLLNCRGNTLTTINVSNNKALERLLCDGNALTSLDISSNTALTQLRCDENQLTSLDVSGSTALTDLSCALNQLAVLDLSNNTALTTLQISPQHVEAAMSTENGKMLLDLGALIGKDNIAKISNVSSGVLDAETGIVTLNDNNTMAKIAYSFDTGAPAVEDASMRVFVQDPAAGANMFNGSPAELDANGNLLINEANFTDEAFRKYVKDSFDADNDGVLTVAEAVAVDSIDCYDMGITSLKGIEYFVMLNNLQCIANQLTEFDLSKNTKLTYLDCKENELTELDLSENTEAFMTKKRTSLKYIRRASGLNPLR